MRRPRGLAWPRHPVPAKVRCAGTRKRTEGLALGLTSDIERYTLPGKWRPLCGTSKDYQKHLPGPSGPGAGHSLGGRSERSIPPTERRTVQPVREGLTQC